MFLAVVAAVVVFVVLLTSDPPSEGRRQEMAMPSGDEAFEITLHDAFIDDGAVTRAWAVDPHAVLGDLVADEERELRFHRDVGGYDGVAIYTVFPNCPFAPEVRVEMTGENMDIDLRSSGGCDADSMRATRAVALEFADGVEPSAIGLTHRDP
ncbi:MAG: hypothetical protein DHS20C19_26060 [Acidimicrobiales bacterium]|nr:MAG: hypothetical protein DHS20C19_26060 [Acidimicrobiales bacterium]